MIKHAGRVDVVMDNEAMLFTAADLPQAIVIPREGRARLSAETRRWASARWSWLRPRTLPMLVAFTGLVAIIASGRYLSNMTPKPPKMIAIEQTVMTASERPIMKIRLVTWGNTSTLVDLSDVPAQ
jgi:hypothetical protein